MEYLDPKKHRAHIIRLFIGYILIGTALILTTIILLYQAYGFGLKNGEVIQNGLVFVSSSPGGAEIRVNGQKRSEQTNARLLMPAGQYSFELNREGYKPWKRAINLEGGTVQRFDYPMLFPSKLNPAATKKYNTKPSIATQSPDRRWLFVQADAAFNAFDVFDFTKPDKAPVAVTVPENIFTLDGTHSWELVEWSNDNSHVLLRHITVADGKTSSEYILVDREKPEESKNLTTVLGANPTKIELRDKKYDQYFIYSAEDRKLQTATLDTPALKPLVDNVQAFKTHGDKTVLYATEQGAPEGKVNITLRDGDQTYVLRTVAADTVYMLELAKYDGNWYMIAGASGENRTYVYQNPIESLNAKPNDPLVPVQVLKTEKPNYIAFSDNARFIMVENGQQFSVYDAEYEKGYTYTTTQPLDAPQTHAEWMDGHRLTYVSGGKAFVLDYDNANREILTASDPQYGPFFDRDYEVLYTLSPEAAKDAAGADITQFVLNNTPLRTEQDQ